MMDSLIHWDVYVFYAGLEFALKTHCCIIYIFFCNWIIFNFINYMLLEQRCFISIYAPIKLSIFMVNTFWFLDIISYSRVPGMNLPMSQNIYIEHLYLQK